MSEPSILPYPKIPSIDSVPELSDRLVYVIDGYPLDGISILIFFKDGKFGVRFGDWDGNLIDPPKADVDNKVGPLMSLMINAKIPQAQFYFSENGKLVDIRTSLNTMTGPGMVRDLCEKILDTQTIISVKILDEDLLKEINNMEYVILKHSSFKVIIRDNEMLPLYAISRSENGQE
jgi:hypothetical protein